MPWVRLDDGFVSHPKVAAAGPLAIAMQVAALCYCNRELTDGFVPRSIARTLLDWQVVRNDGRVFGVAVTSGMAGDDVTCGWVVDVLVEAGMWEVVEGGYRIHDYHDYQPSKADVVAGREANARRQAEFRERQKRNGGSNALYNGPVTGMSQPPRTRTRTPNDTDTSADVSVSPQQHIEPNATDKRRRRALHAFPEGFDLTDDRRAVAECEGVDADREWQRFRDHAAAKDQRYKDWDAAWRNWCRSPFQRKNGRPPGAETLARPTGRGTRVSGPIADRLKEVTR